MTSNGGVYFVPGFHGLQAPVMDPSATAGFIGLTLATTRQEMLRSLLESIAFSQKQLVEAFLSETDYKFEKLIVDGGVARNDFILQMIANLTGRRQAHLRLGSCSRSPGKNFSISLITDKQKMLGNNKN